jgi:hypothetical protein
LRFSSKIGDAGVTEVRFHRTAVAREAAGEGWPVPEEMRERWPLAEEVRE